jgi:chlorite dismutase
MYHNYIFFDLKDSMHNISKPDVEKFKKSFAEIIEKHTSVTTFTYDTTGLKYSSRFLLWCQSDEVTDIQNLISELLQSTFGQHLKITYTLFGITRPSQYGRKNPDGTPYVHVPKPGEADQHIKITDPREKYLIIYPFTKTTDWHLLPFDERRRIMVDHIKTAHGFAPIKQLLLHSFGIDDHEFIVSYETDSLTHFQDLVMALRNTEGRGYTENDTPIYTCIYKPLPELLASIC